MSCGDGPKGASKPHDVDLARVRLVPDTLDDFHFLKAQALIESIRNVVICVHALFHGLDLDEGKSLLHRIVFCRGEEAAAVAFSMAGLQDTHHGQFHRGIARLLQAEKSHRLIFFTGCPVGPVHAFTDVLLSTFFDLEPLRKRLQDRTSDRLFLICISNKPNH